MRQDYTPATKEQSKGVDKKLSAIDKEIQLVGLSEEGVRIMEEIGDNIRVEKIGDTKNAQGEVIPRNKFNYTYRGQQFESGLDENGDAYLSIGGRKILGDSGVPESMRSGEQRLANAHARDIYFTLHTFERIAQIKRDPTNVANNFIKGMVG